MTTLLYDLSPAPFVCGLTSLVQVPDLAQQLTAYEYQLFIQITRDEFLGLKWSKPGKNERARNVLRYINHFNRLSSWVVREIITKYVESLRLPRPSHY